MICAENYKLLLHSNKAWARAHNAHLKSLGFIHHWRHLSAPKPSHWSCGRLGTDQPATTSWAIVLNTKSSQNKINWEKYFNDVKMINPVLRIVFVPALGNNIFPILYFQQSRDWPSYVEAEFYIYCGHFLGQLNLYVSFLFTHDHDHTLSNSGRKLS